MYPRRRPPRRARPGALIVAASVLSLCAACTSSGGDPAPDPSPSADSPTATPSPTESNAPVTLRLAVYGGASELAAYRRVARVYHAREPNVTVNVETAPDAGTAQARLDRQFEVDRPPDMFLADSNAVAQLVQQERVQPVDELLEDRDIQFGDKFERLGLEAFAAESALQCMPNDVSPYVVFYNRDLVDLEAIAVEDRPAPTPEVNGWSWRQFALAAQTTSVDGVQGVYLPPHLTTLAPLIRSAGADIVDDVQAPTTLTLAEPAAREPLEQILDLARDSRVNPTPPQLLRQDAVTRFENGRLAMMIGTRAMVPRLRQARDLSFDAYPLPSFGRFQTIADVSGYCISRDSEQIEEAADFLAFASGDEGAKITARSGGIVPANLTALRSPAFEQPGQSPANINVFTNVIRRAETMPNPLAWTTVVSRTQPLIGELFYSTVLDLEAQLAEIDEVSAAALAEPTETPSPSGSSSSTASPSG